MDDRVAPSIFLFLGWIAQSPDLKMPIASLRKLIYQHIHGTTAKRIWLKAETNGYIKIDHETRMVWITEIGLEVHKRKYTSVIPTFTKVDEKLFASSR